MDLNPSDVVDEPDAAADAAADVDEPGSGDPPEQAAPSSATTSESRTEKIRDMLFSTSPEKDLDDVDAPYDPERGGLNRVYRGLQKMVDVDGLPAVADIGIGIAEWLDLAEPMDQDGSESGNSQNSQNGESESERPADLDAALNEVKS